MTFHSQLGFALRKKKKREVEVVCEKNDKDPVNEWVYKCMCVYMLDITCVNKKMLRWLAYKHKNPVTWCLLHLLHTKQTVHDLFNVCSNHASLNYSEQESKNNLQFMILTYRWPWNKVKVIKSGMNCKTLSKVKIMQILTDLP